MKFIRVGDEIIRLDLVTHIKEGAKEGMGSHGLCIGATGSGKSEFLRTLVLGMLSTHSSATLNFVLVDFKGGATFLNVVASGPQNGEDVKLYDQKSLRGHRRTVQLVVG